MKLVNLFIKRKCFNKRFQSANYYCEKFEKIQEELKNKNQICIKDKNQICIKNNNQVYELLQKIYAKNEQIEKMLIELKNNLKNK